MPSKIINLENVLAMEDSSMAYGHFSTIHPGHIRYLRYAKEQGKKLVVALLGDCLQNNKSKYQFKQLERAESLALLDIADSIVLLNNNELSQAIANIKPKALILGKEFENSSEIEILNSIDLMNKSNLIVQFHAGEVHYATAELLTSSETDLAEIRKKQFRSACERQGLILENLLDGMEKWKSTNLLVVGDSIVDQYAACEAVGMSAEAPVVVVRELEKRNFIGGAAIVASHIRALGAQCQFLSVVGADRTADLLKKELKTRDIGDFLINDASRPTTFKKRYLVENQKLFRVSRLEDHNLSNEIENQLIERLVSVAPSVNGIVVSDFVYGVITDRILETIQHLARKYNLLLFGDLQCSSQVGLVTRFKNFSLLCPNEKEARIALQDKEIGLERLSQKLMSETQSNRLIMKLGAEGFIAYDHSPGRNNYNQPFPALSVNPLDVAGAGDSLLAVMATGLASKQSMMASAALGCCMASLAVDTMGNTPIRSDALTKTIKEIMSSYE